MEIAKQGMKNFLLKNSSAMENRNIDALKKRFKDFALEVVKFTQTLPSAEKHYQVIIHQIIRSSTSSAANYRAACRGKSTPDFRAKLGIVEELDETMFWLEFLVGISEDWRTAITPHWKEADELLAITVASLNTSRKNKNYPNNHS